MTMFLATCLAVGIGVALFVVRLAVEQRRLDRLDLASQGLERGNEAL